MNVKEMFEKLEYKCTEYENQIIYERSFENYFVFDKTAKTIGIGAYHITLKELELINMQAKELRWLDE